MCSTKRLFEQPPSSYSLLTFVLAAIALWLLMAVLIVQVLPTWEVRNAFGGMFGAANSLFSGLALAGVIYTIFLQQKELRLQREELERAATAHEEDFNLSRVRFLLDLSGEFSQYERSHEEARRILRRYDPSVSSMNSQAWDEAVEALEQLYRASLFLNQVSNLLQSGIIKREPLYLMYYRKITHKPDDIIKELYKWLGTGLELAANFKADEVLKLTQSFEYLLTEMNDEHEKRGSSGYQFQIDSIKEVKDELR